MGRSEHRCERLLADEIVSKTMANMLRDCDVRNLAHAVCDGMEELLASCEIQTTDGEDAYTDALVDAYIGFAVAPRWEACGSLANYCATNAVRATCGYRLRLHDDANADELLHGIRVGIHATGLNPRRSFGTLARAGVPIGRKGNR